MYGACRNDKTKRYNEEPNITKAKRHEQNGHIYFRCPEPLHRVGSLPGVLKKNVSLGTE